MTLPSLPTLTRTAVLAGLLALGSSASAQDGTIYPLEALPNPTLFCSARAVSKAKPRRKAGSASGAIRWRETSRRRR